MDVLRLNALVKPDNYDRIFYMTHKIYIWWINSRFTIMMRTGNYTTARISYMEDPNVRMFVSHKFHQYRWFNCLQRAKHISELDAKPIVGSYLSLKINIQIQIFKSI